MEFQIAELPEEHQIYNRNTHAHTHTHTHTQTHTHHASTHTTPKRQKLHKLFKKGHMSDKYLLALKGVFIFC